MFNFKYYAPTKVVFGRDTENKLASLLKEYGGTRVLLHFGGQSAIKSGLIDRVKKNLDEAGIFYVELGGVVANPHLCKVQEGIEFAKKNKIDFIVAIGGGSVIDSAKAIAYGLAESEYDVWDLFQGKRRAKSALALGVIVTISAAGSEMSNSTVITNEKTGEKRNYSNDLSRPKFAIMNPELTMTLPDYQTQSGCVDMMMHTMERYLTQGGNMEVTDAIAEGLLKVIMKNAEILHQEPLNYNARAEIMWAGSLAHNNLTGCGSDGGDFATHMLEHELGGMFNVTHGAGLAALWPSWAKYVYRDNLPRFAKFAMKVFDIRPTSDGMGYADIALEGIKAMENFYHRIGMPTTMTELGIKPTDEQIKQMATSCASATGGKIGSSKILYEQDMITIYNMAK